MRKRFAVELRALTDEGVLLFPVATPTADEPKAFAPLVRWSDAATSNRDTLRQWARTWPGCGWGCVVPDGVLVVDFDGAEGIASWERLCSKLGPAPSSSWRVSTPSGGLHVYARCFYRRGWRQRSGIAPGVDVRLAHRGVLRLPPSPRPDGGYDWIGDWRPSVVPELDDWSLRWVRFFDDVLTVDDEAGSVPTLRPLSPGSGQHPWAQRAVEGICGDMSSAGPGSRNHTLNATAYRLGRLVAASWSGLDADDVLDRLALAALSTGLKSREVQRTLRSGFAAGADNPLPEPVGGRR